MTQRHRNNGIACPSRVCTDVLGTMHVCTAISAIGALQTEISLLFDSIETCHHVPGPGETLYLAAPDAMMVRGCVSAFAWDG